jgi:hypothetical protein
MVTTHLVLQPNDDEPDHTNHAQRLNLRESFQALDADHSGHLSLGEVVNAMHLVGLDLKKRTVLNNLHGVTPDKVRSCLLPPSCATSTSPALH